MSTAELDRAIDSLKSAVPDVVLGANREAYVALKRTVSGLPPEVVQLFLQIGGMKPTVRLPMYLLSPEEIVDTVNEFRALQGSGDGYWESLAPIGNGQTGILLFADGGGNYLGIYAHPPYYPRCFIFDHEEPSIRPDFKSLASMIHAVVDCLDNDNAYFGVLNTDYPVNESSAVELRDRHLSMQLLKEFRDVGGSSRDKIFAAINLSHPDDIEAFMPFLDSEDMWISEALCRLVGRRKYKQGICSMTRAAIKYRDHRTLAAISVLRDWTTKEASDALRTLKDSLGKDYAAYFPENFR